MPQFLLRNPRSCSGGKSRYLVTACIVAIRRQPSLGLNAACVAAVRDHPRDFAKVGINWGCRLEGLQDDVA